MPDWKTIVRQRLAPLRISGSAESDFVEELAQHLEDRYAELRSGGATEEGAYRAVTAELEDAGALRNALRKSEQMPRQEHVPVGDPRSSNFFDETWRDLRYALRTLRKNPVFALFVVGTLALGIGANTTVFTVINTLILNPLPVKDASRIAAVNGTNVAGQSASGTTFPISYPDLQDYRARNHVFLSLAGYSAARIVTFQENGASERMFSELVTHDYFSTLGLTPAKGRYFLPQEDDVPGAHAVAVLSYGTWRLPFGARNDIIGSTLRLNGIEFTIVGVAPPHFIGVNAIFGPDVWVPAAMAETLLPNELQSALSDRGKSLFTAIGRYKNGASEEQAQAEMATIAASLAHDYPAADENHTVAVRPVTDVVFGSAGTGATPIRFAGIVLLIVVGIVLLIACSNVANLMLARSASRRQEFAVRLAMGASRQRLVRQLLTESVLLGLLSGAAGLFIGYAGLQLLFGNLPSAANFASPKLDGTVLGFALLISLATAFLFGTMPALKASRASVADTLKEETRTAGRSHRRITVANALVVVQVAFSFVLLVTAALFLRSIARAYQLDPGFQTAHLAIFMTNPGQTGFSRTRTKAFYKDALEHVAAMPGVASVSWASNLPLWAKPVNGLEVEGRQQRSRTDKVRSIVTVVDVGYFETAGVSITGGRRFTVGDRENSAPVIIVNEKMARDYWPNGALGKRVRLPNETQMRQIVGIAKNANYTSWGESPQACVYVPLDQNFSDSMTLFVRSERDPHQLLQAVEKEVRAVAPEVLVSSTRTGSEIVDGGLFQARMGVGLLTVFGMLALGLASVGLYGLLAYSVNQRKREIGLRMALGASSSSVLRLVLKQGMTLVGAGVLIGFIAALGAGRLLSGMLFGVSAADPLSVGAAAFALCAIALVACYLPAFLATRVDPLSALREA